MKRLVILGAGGQGREVADIVWDAAQRGGELEAVGFIDENRALHGRNLDHLPVLGDWSYFDHSDRSSLLVICAVGSPRNCVHLSDRAAKLGLSFGLAVSPSAHVSRHAHLGQGITLFPNSVINSGAHLGDHCIVNIGASISHDVTVGRCTNVNPGARLAGNVTIGEACYIGMGANIIQGCTVGDGAIIGAGAVVTRDLPANVTAVGVPARVIEVRK